MVRKELPRRICLRTPHQPKTLLIARAIAYQYHLSPLSAHAPFAGWSLRNMCRHALRVWMLT